VTSATANNSQAESLMLSSTARKATGRPPEIAVALAHTTEAKQQPRIARPVLLVRPRKTIRTITMMNASAHPE